MKRLIKIAVAFALLLAANGVFAQDYNEDDAGTTYGLGDNTNAGTTISNTATVTYEVNDVEQEQEINNPAAQFVVDRVILVNVASAGDTTVAPAEQDAVLTFTVTNNSNATLDLVLATSQLGGTFNATGLTLWRESEAVPDGFDSGTDTQLTFPVGAAGIILADMSEEEVATIYVVGDIPAAASITDPVDGADADIILLATAYENVVTPLAADIVVETDPTQATANEADAMFVDTVFGDLDGDYADTDAAGPDDDDTDEDGEHSTTGSFIVGTASIAVSKTSVVLNDPFNDTTNPKAIPGAEVLYCIEVANTGGTVAENVSVRDPIPTGTTYVDDSIEVFTADITCAAAIVSTGSAITDDDTDSENANYSGNSGDTTLPLPDTETTDTVVNTTVGTVAATNGVTATIFRVTID